MDDLVEQWIAEYQASAEKWGGEAAAAVEKGDQGTARTASRQAAKYAKMVLDLKTSPAEAEPHAPVRSDEPPLE